MSSIIANTLTSVITANSNDIATKGLTRSRTVGLIGVRQGIKGTEHTFSIDTTDLVIQDVSNCGIIVSGGTTILPVPVSVDKLGTRQSICQAELEDKFNATDFAAGQNNDDASLKRFAAVYIAEKCDTIGYTIDKLLWQGNKATGTGNLKKSDGFIAKLKAVSASTQNIASSALTAANAVAVINAYYDALPAEAKSKKTATLFMSYAEMYIANAVLPAQLQFTNHENPYIDGFNWPYRPLRIEAVHGLDGTTRKILCADPKRLMKIATDLSSDMTEGGVKFWHSEDDDIHYFQMKWAQGVGVAIPSYFVNDLL
jgi:hypothetical protein